MRTDEKAYITETPFRSRVGNMSKRWARLTEFKEKVFEIHFFLQASFTMEPNRTSYRRKLRAYGHEQRTKTPKRMGLSHTKKTNENEFTSESRNNFSNEVSV